MSRQANPAFPAEAASRRLLTLAAVVLSVAVLSACGTGLEAQTYKETGRHDGGATTLQGLAVRNLYVQAPSVGSTIPAGGSAIVWGILANTNDTPDALVSASTDVAQSAVLQEGGRPVTSVPVPPRGASTSTWSIVLSGLTKDLRAGTYVSITLVFDKAERTTVQVPVRAGDNGLGSRPTARDPYSEG